MSLDNPTFDERVILNQLYDIFRLKESYFNDVRLMKVYRCVVKSDVEDVFDTLRELERQYHKYHREETFREIYRLADAVTFSKYPTSLGLPQRIRKHYLDY